MDQFDHLKSRKKVVLYITYRQELFSIYQEQQIGLNYLFVLHSKNINPLIGFQCKLIKLFQVTLLIFL